MDDTTVCSTDTAPTPYVPKVVTKEKEEHWSTWLSRKQHKTHFYDRQYCQAEPMANTPGLYDASAEARAILQDTLDNWYVATEDIPKPDNTIGVGVLCDALDYLKGRDIGNRFSHAFDFFLEASDTEDETRDQAEYERAHETGSWRNEPTPST